LATSLTRAVAHRNWLCGNPRRRDPRHLRKHRLVRVTHIFGFEY
jgi:hypothetical protein